MNKKDLVETLSEKCNLEKNVVEQILNEMNSIIVDCLKKEDCVKISGFGTFSLSKRNAKLGKNPKTGESLQIPAKNVVKFKMSKEMKDEINK